MVLTWCVAIITSLFCIITSTSDYREFGLVIGFIDHLQIVIISNYNAFANSYVRLLTTTHTRSSQFVFTTRFLVTDPNNFICLFSYRLTSASQWTHRQTGHLTTPSYFSHWLNSTYCSFQIFPLIISRHGPHRKHSSSLNCLHRKYVCLQSRYSARDLVYIFLSRCRCSATSILLTGFHF
jgi:hypothetical protein